jgi:hypothetical protein
MTSGIRRALFTLSALVLLAIDLGAPRPTPGASIPLPQTSAVGDTPPPLSATATPHPVGTLLRYSGQILDYREGYVFFTTGDGYHVAPDVVIDAAGGKGKTQLQPVTRVYALATFDSASGKVVELGLSSTPLASEATYDDIKKFAVALSTPFDNPDMNSHAQGFDGKPVQVEFTVEVPPDTAFDATVYLATDASGWSATAIRMDRVDALHYRVTRTFASGTKLLFRYTLGSWQSAERGQNGLAVAPRPLVVHNGDVQSERDVVYHWGQSDQFDPGSSQAPPTPFNPIPFNTPPSAPGGAPHR